MRQNWGESTITLLQEVRLPVGHYTLTADVWKSGLGGDAIVQVKSVGAQPTERVAKLLAKQGLCAAPVINERPQKSAPKAKAQERAKAKAEAAAAAAEAAAAPAEG